MDVKPDALGATGSATQTASAAGGSASPSAPVGERRTSTPAGRLNVASLRRAVPVRTWGGKGSGQACDFCRVLIASDDVEYEVEAQLDGSTLMLRFHYRCHYAWTGGEDPFVTAERA